VDNIIRDPFGWLLLGVAGAAAVFLLEGVFRLLFRRHEAAEGRYPHRVANELPRELDLGGTDVTIKSEWDLAPGEKVMR
jgi:hypothetical protein